MIRAVGSDVGKGLRIEGAGKKVIGDGMEEGVLINPLVESAVIKSRGKKVGDFSRDLQHAVNAGGKKGGPTRGKGLIREERSMVNCGRLLATKRKLGRKKRNNKSKGGGDIKKKKK